MLPKLFNPNQTFPGPQSGTVCLEVLSIIKINLLYKNGKVFFCAILVHNMYVLFAFSKWSILSKAINSTLYFIIFIIALVKLSWSKMQMHIGCSSNFFSRKKWPFDFFRAFGYIWPVSAIVEQDTERETNVPVMCNSNEKPPH